MKSTSILVVMGVSGCGKSTIGTMLSDSLQLPFFDGDDFHTEPNVQKMSEGLPLTDNDRIDWLKRLNQLAITHRDQGAVIACSALKKSYRQLLITGLENQMEFIYLQGTFDEVSERLARRTGHFMPPNLLNSQFDALEPPVEAVVVSIQPRPEEMLTNILQQLEIKKP